MNDESRKFYDYYRLLDLDPSASVETIKAARRRLLGVHFVDKHQGCEAALEMTLRLNEAKEVLLEPERRQEYDCTWRDHWNRARTRQRPPAETARIIRGHVHRPKSRTANGAALGFGLGTLLLGAAYAAYRANEFDDRADRFRGRDGKFRKGRFSR